MLEILFLISVKISLLSTIRQRSLEYIHIQNRLYSLNVNWYNMAAVLYGS